MPLLIHTYCLNNFFSVIYPVACYFYLLIYRKLYLFIYL